MIVYTFINPFTCGEIKTNLQLVTLLDVHLHNYI